MEQQLRILTNPQTSTKTLEPLRTKRQWLTGAAYPITEAAMYAYDSDTLIASGSLLAGTLNYVGTDQNQLEYNWTNAEVDSLSQIPKAHYRVLWLLNNGERTIEDWFSVVFWKLYNPIDEQDLLNEKPELNNFRPQIALYTTAASSGSLLNCNLISDATGFYNGSIIIFDAGELVNQEYRVKNWDVATHQFELFQPLQANVAMNIKFTLRRSYMPEITSAWDEILMMVQSWNPTVTSDYGYYTPLAYSIYASPNISVQNSGTNWAVDGYDFRQLHLYRAMMKICSALRSKDKDAFSLLKEEYSNYYEKALSELRAKIDTNKDGVFDSNDTLIGGNRWFLN